MFRKKKKPNFPLRPPYSIHEELETLKPFVRRDKIGAMRPYTIEDIQVTEQRLNFELPTPVRELYLVMGDYMCLQDEFYFRALELLRWDGDYLLLVHGVSDNIGFGLKRSDSNVTVYEWICNTALTEKEIENDQHSYVRFENDFEVCQYNGDKVGAEIALKNYFDFWHKKRFRSEIAKFSISQNTYAQFTYFWDAFIIHFVLCKMVDSAYYLDKDKMTDQLDQCYVSKNFPLQIGEQNKVCNQIVWPFVPISSHMELIFDSKGKYSETDSSYGLAYINKEDDCLLLMHPDSKYCYYLLTTKLVPYSFAQKIGQKIGIDFYSRHGNGKD